MKPVDQDKFHDRETGARGNCQQAAVASILELPLHQVPNFHDCEEGFWAGFNNFVRSRGMAILALRNGDFDYWLRTSGVHYLAYGPAERGVLHAVVYRGGKLAHDPHPSRAGLLQVDEVNVLVPLL
ncbi:hypothetical protein HAP48_0042605 [Bradyrhizobium septentrionale]|uniref:Uncharacterized protein n=1 Tax=Bradyrhizobium septentrionale TaxID=1404411 RepID=A0A973W2H0_9BRAD|nr:hypothetical protein [Bradyrhizobium septentrionale]UGY15151.1 hypothetical protein HAP48_0042605 [Bradyrhizobium septentrionale]